MSKIETNLSDRIDSDIERLVGQGDFVNREQAVEELLTLGMSAFDTGGSDTTMESDDLFSQTVDDQQDPAARMDDGDGHGF